jgi:hypothetical protein
VVFQAAGGGGAAPAAEPVRLDPRSDRDERLRSYRAKDPALNQAAELLDLELTE